MATVYLLLALSAVLIFSSLVNCHTECIETRPPPGLDSSGISQAENFTSTNCPCYDRCLKPSITLEPGMHAYAACTVPMSEHPGRYQNRVQMFLYPPGGQCVVFQSETDDVWYHHDKHVHFRRKDETVEVFIVDVNMQDHHDLSVVCKARRTNGRLIEGCSSEDSTSTATIYVEADSERTGWATSIPTDYTLIHGVTDSPQVDCNCSECVETICPKMDNSGCTETICPQTNNSGYITATGVGWSIVGILLAIIAVLLLFLFCKPLHKYVDKVTRN